MVTTKATDEQKQERIGGTLLGSFNRSAVLLHGTSLDGKARAVGVLLIVWISKRSFHFILEWYMVTWWFRCCVCSCSEEVVAVDDNSINNRSCRTEGRDQERGASLTVRRRQFWRLTDVCLDAIC